jgi:ParB-like chromosome segregation protein Spo0J
MIIEKKKISDLIPAPYNPRQSTAKQEKHLKESLEKFGLVEPIIFNKQTGYIVGGHFRVRELKKLGIKEIECVIVDLNEADEKELNIRLNANTGSWDWDTLANDWDVVDLEAWGLDIPQFDTVEELEASEEQEEMNVIELKFYDKDYKIVKEKLNSISMSPEIAVLKLLGVE